MNGDILNCCSDEWAPALNNSECPRFVLPQPVPERIADKRARNDCTFFSLRATVERETSSASGRPDDPRRALNDLFKN
jgi:hypothetical protein